MTKDGIDNQVLVHSWLLFDLYVLRWPCMLSNVQIMFVAKKSDRCDITELLLKVALNTLNQSKPVTILMPAHKPIPMTSCTYMMFIYTYVNCVTNKVITFVNSIACWFCKVKQVKMLRCVKFTRVPWKLRQPMSKFTKVKLYDIWLSFSIVSGTI